MGSDIDGEAANDESASGVGLSSDGSVLAVGAPLNSGTGPGSGHVRVYAWNSSASRWDQRGSDINGEASLDSSGSAVSLSSDGSVVAIGAPYNDGNGSDSGHVRVYMWNAGTSTWTQRGGDIDGEYAGDQSGWAVSLSADGTVVAIGARFNDGGGSNSGHVRTYAWDASTSSWLQRGSDLDGAAAGDLAGFAVSLWGDGSVVAVGSYLADRSGATNVGRVTVFGWSGSSWVSSGSVEGEAAGDSFGYSVSLARDYLTLAVGAPNNDGAGSGAGHTRVYEWNGSSWAQRGTDLDGEAAGDFSGRSVSLSADGQYVAIAAPWNDGSYSQSGSVRVFGWSGTSWSQRGVDLDGEALDDESGYALSISGDASTVAIGSRQNDGSGTSAGHVRVYRW